jgi:AraC family transcriptional regulator of adaptative response/methylated-DNA-[protein]-cysteine methyltransferase
MFVYAVRTTGIFCVPVCGSRRPNKSNVTFYGSSAEAVAAGFRPCKRCRPHREQISPHIDMITRARRLAVALKQGPTVTDANYEAEASRGYDAMEQALGMAPARYRQDALGESIRYAIAKSNLGPIVVAGTAIGIRAIEFGETKAAPARRLGKMFPKAELMPADVTYRK